MKMITTAIYNYYLISSFIQSPVTPYFLVQNNLIITLFSKTLKLSSFLGVTGQISNPHTMTKLSALYTSCLTFSSDT